jgi:hypothetical protein
VFALDITPTLSTDIKRTPLSSFFVDGSTIESAQIIGAGPKNARFIGAGSGFLAVRAPGTYTIALRFERPPRANCGLPQAPRFWNAQYRFELYAARFDLQPGLYPISWVFGCWKDQEAVGPGRISVLVGHPGDQALHLRVPMISFDRSG